MKSWRITDPNQLNFDIDNNAKTAVGFAREAIVDTDSPDIDAAIDALKTSLAIQESQEFGSRHFDKKNKILNMLKPLINKGKPIRPLCSTYEPGRDGKYELFRTYYNIVQQISLIEERQYSHIKPTKHTDICAVVQFNYYRWVDLGTPSISGYNRYKEIIKYSTLFLTLVANVFKLALAKLGGRASFVGTLLQGLAHLSFTLYFIFLSRDDKALALPKFIGLVISIISCIWIADAGNGFL
jgi:hypothetical protein